MSEQFRVPPFHYIHVLDNNASVTCVLSGPTTFTKQDHERVVVKPTPMVVLPSRTYCVVLQPAQRKENTKEVITDMHGQVQLRHGDREIRLASDWPEPFVLYPGEMLSGGIQQLLIVKPDTALHLKALRKFTDNIGDKEVERVAGDEWMFRGPATYYPLVEAKILETLIAQTIGKNEALKIRAKNSYQDRQGVKRKAGEEYLVRTPGGFLPDVNEEVLGTVKPQIITQQIALHLCAAQGHYWIPLSSSSALAPDRLPPACLLPACLPPALSFAACLLAFAACFFLSPPVLGRSGHARGVHVSTSYT